MLNAPLGVTRILRVTQLAHCALKTRFLPVLGLPLVPIAKYVGLVRAHYLVRRHVLAMLAIIQMEARVSHVLLVHLNRI